MNSEIRVDMHCVEPSRLCITEGLFPDIMKQIFISLILIMLISKVNGQDSLTIISKWKLASYEAFEKVRKSEGYLFGTEEQRQLVDKTSKLLLDSVQYEFKSNGLMVYKDVENLAVIERTAYWKIQGDILFIDEVKRPYNRQAKILTLNERILVITPIINGLPGESKMIFNRM